MYDNFANAEADRTRGRIKWADLRAQHPDILHASVRAAGASGYVDPDFAYNYDESEAAGFKTTAYVNASSSRSASSLLAIWKQAIGTRKPKLISVDAETWGAGLTPAANAKHMQDCIKAVEDTWPDALHDDYTAPWCWNNQVIHGWEGAEKLWDAHYPFFVQNADGTWRVVYSFEELDKFLPIGNSFTPSIPTGFSQANCWRWQVSDKAILFPITQPGKLLPRCDIGYMLRSLYDQLWPSSTPPQPPPVTPLTVKIEYHQGVALDIKQV